MPKVTIPLKVKDEKALSFPIQFYSLKPISNTLSKARAKIFYKGENSNGTFIDNDVADMMIWSLDYCPIKGVYDGEDFTQHTADRSEGKVYGVVPEWKDGGWENWIDDDGIGRNYYCCDVILFTALFPEASEIEGKSLSMELYVPTLDGFYERLPSGRMVLHLTHAEFSGLQVLGDDVLPCFEGAGFYSKDMTQETLKEEINKVWTEYNKKSKETKIGGLKMGEVRYTISDEMAKNSLFTALNPKYNEEGGYTADYALVDEEKGLVYNLSEGKLQTATAEEKDGETTYTFADYELVEAQEPVEEDVTNAAAAIADYALEVEEGTSRVDKFNKLTAEFEAAKNEISELSEKVSNYEKEKVESDEKISTLVQEKENLQAEYTKLDEETKAQIEELSAYKANDEREKKVALISTYNDKLDKESIDKFVEGVDNYTLDSLDKELAYTLVKSNPSLFSKEPDGGLIPKDDADNTGLNAILSKYDK